MKYEQIEKAADIEMLSYYADEVYPSDIKDIQSDFIEAFSKGARWRINSVWHDASEKPNGNNKCLVELRIPGRNPTYKLWTWGWENSFVTRWAYIEDLLPDRKEDER